MTDDFRPLLRACLALKPFLAEVVVIGGWVPALYARYGGLDWQGRLSRTQEADILTLPPLPRVEGVLTLDSLLREHGFQPRVQSELATVWESEMMNGEGIEFLTPRIGPVKRQAAVRLGDHGVVAAMPIDDVQILARNTTTFSVPLRATDNPGGSLEIRVPTLAAYVVNKAATFPKRQSLAGEFANPKQAKDLVYLRDVMAAGAKTIGHLESSLKQLRHAGRPEIALVTKAHSNLNLLLAKTRPGWPGLPRLAAQQVTERDGGALPEREAELRGYLADLCALLKQASSSAK